MRVDWANNLLLVTSALALFITYRAIQRGAKYWPVVLLAFSVLLQNHLSSAPLIAGLGVGLLLSWREIRIRTNYYLALVSLLVLWCFPLMYEFLYESNFYSLLTTHSGSSGESAGIQAALAVLSDRAFLPVLAVGIVAFFGALRESPKIVREFWLAIILGLVFFTGALFRLQPPLHVYYAYCLLPIFPIFLGFCFARFGRSVFVLLAIYAVLNINPVVVEPTHSLIHAQEVAQIIQANSTSTPKIRINKADGLRVNSIYHFLSGNTFGRMMYSRRFKEFPFVKDENGHSLRSAGSQGFYLRCKNPEKPFPSKKWQVAGELSLETCSTCTGCKLFQLTRRQRAESY